tara:strand:- start:436 stop:696 length:261 start_codon:yes stop_codon:yes gene_type:complete
MSLFNVGEEVIIQGKIFKGFNGMEATITYVSETPRRMVGRYFGFVYKTSLDTDDYLYWEEASLRKKHKPSTQSLSTMIEELNKVRA